MDKERRKELKRLGKAEVERYSAEVKRRLHEENPFHYTDPRWVENYKEINAKNKAFRNNETTIFREPELKGAYLREIGIKFEDNWLYFPRAGWYVRCLKCRCLLPLITTQELRCDCGAVALNPQSKQATIPSPELYDIVELKGKGSIRSRPWWKFWA